MSYLSRSFDGCDQVGVLAPQGAYLPPAIRRFIEILKKVTPGSAEALRALA